MRTINSRDYWRKREEEQLKHYIKSEAEYDKEIQKIYQTQLDAIQKEIEAFYGKYAAKENITLAEAKKRVSKHDVKAFERKAKRYVEEKNFSKKANEELRLYNLTMKVNRLEMLKANIGLETIALSNELDKFMSDILQGRTEEELKRQAGILGKTIRNNAQLAHTIPNASFHNATFSDRIWQYQDLMREDLSKILSSGLIAGKNPRAIAKDLKKYWYGADPKTGGGAVYCMERLMRTELARVQTEAQKQSFEKNGFTEYMFIANSDCCGICKALDGKHFKVSKMMPGENAAPLHPHCRCSVAAYEDSDEYEEWLSFLEKGGTTAEWEQIKQLDTVSKLNAQKEKWLKEQGYDIYGDSLLEMEKGFREEASDGSMPKETAYMQAINNRINALTQQKNSAKTLTKSVKSSKISSKNTSSNPPVVVGGVNCTVSKSQYGFGDGAGGVRKTANATIYKTPDGTEFVFPDRYNNQHQTMTPEQAIANWQRVPQSIKQQAQKTIEIVDYYNPQDSYWRKHYKNFGHSYATGGDKITFYRYDRVHNDDYIVRTYCHEAGHLIDTNLAAGTGKTARFSAEPVWQKAMADDKAANGKKSCTAYGENSPTEDFAESIAEYVKDKNSFTKDFPNRAAVLANII